MIVALASPSVVALAVSMERYSSVALISSKEVVPESLASRPSEATAAPPYQRKMKVGRAVIGLFALLVGMGLVGLSLWMQKDHGDSALLAAVGGCMFSFLGLALTAIFWMPWLMKGAGALASLCGPSAKLADTEGRGHESQNRSLLEHGDIQLPFGGANGAQQRQCLAALRHEHLEGVGDHQGGHHERKHAECKQELLASQWNLKVGDTMVVNSSANTDEAHPEGFAATIVGLTDDPHNAYGFYGGAAVASDGPCTMDTGSSLASRLVAITTPLAWRSCEL